MSDKLTVLKLGGSVITNKAKPFTPNSSIIERLTSEIHRANISPLIIVHGGGSFGHPVADQYKIQDGYTNSLQIIGFSRTHHAMTLLNNLVIESLLNHGVPAVEVSPCSCIITKAGRIRSIEERTILRMLEMSFVPILYGDAVLDTETGFAILSGDQLVTSIAMRFAADRIIIGTDVNGIYTADPKLTSSANLIQSIPTQELRKALQASKEPRRLQETDVTGGMPAKILEIIPAAEQGVRVQIVNAAKPNRIYKALKGEKVVGTIITKGEANV